MYITDTVASLVPATITWSNVSSNIAAVMSLDIIAAAIMFGLAVKFAPKVWRLIKRAG